MTTNRRSLCQTARMELRAGAVVLAATLALTAACATADATKRPTPREVPTDDVSVLVHSGPVANDSGGVWAWYDTSDREVRTVRATQPSSAYRKLVTLDVGDTITLLGVAGNSPNGGKYRITEVCPSSCARIWAPASIIITNSDGVETELLADLTR